MLRGQIRGLLQKIDMDGKMKKMAELQLSIVSDPKNRKAIENQVRKCFCTFFFFHDMMSFFDIFVSCKQDSACLCVYIYMPNCHNGELYNCVVLVLKNCT